MGMFQLEQLDQSDSFAFPGRISRELMRVAATPIPYMRHAEFSSLVMRCEEMLLELVDNAGGRCMPFTASGTAAMEAVVAQYVGTKQKPCVLVGGGFGKRWVELCSYHGIQCVEYTVPYARDLDYEDWESFLIEQKPDVFLCQHHETSSGQLFDMERIGRVCKRLGISLVVDAISSFLSDPFSMREMGVDMAVISSQKGLSILPGLAFIFLSPALQGYEFSHSLYYFDFQENLKNLDRGQTPYSPATQLFMMLHARLLELKSMGREAEVARVRRNALAFREAIAPLGLSSNPECPSNCVTAFYVDRAWDIFMSLYAQGVYVMPGGDENLLRVSHIGYHSEEDFAKLASLLQRVLGK